MTKEHSDETAAHDLAAWAICGRRLDWGGLGPAPGRPPPVDKWVEASGQAAGTDERARDEAKGYALRTAVEEACGVFLTAQSKTRDYKAVYDKVFANTVGYVNEFKIEKTVVENGVTTVVVRALVSTRKFEEDWAAIAHTIEQENNPRLIVAIVEAIHQTTTGPAYEVKENGIVQSEIEEFLLSKGITLMDRATAASITKRDVLLAAIKDDAGRGGLAGRPLQRRGRRHRPGQRQVRQDPGGIRPDDVPVRRHPQRPRDPDRLGAGPGDQELRSGHLHLRSSAAAGRIRRWRSWPRRALRRCSPPSWRPGRTGLTSRGPCS